MEAQMIPTIRPADLESRDGLRRIFMASAPTNAIRTGLHLGNCEMLGAFDRIPPSGKPGWICRCWTRTNPTFRHLAIVVDNEAQSHRVIEIPRVPWEHWAGKAIEHKAPQKLGTRFWMLNWGDFPADNQRSFEEALRARESDLTPDAHDDPSDPPAGRDAAEKQGLFARVLAWVRAGRKAREGWDQ